MSTNGITDISSEKNQKYERAMSSAKEQRLRSCVKPRVIFKKEAFIFLHRCISVHILVLGSPTSLVRNSGVVLRQRENCREFIFSKQENFACLTRWFSVNSVRFCSGKKQCLYFNISAGNFVRTNVIQMLFR